MLFETIGCGDVSCCVDRQKLVCEISDIKASHTL